MSIPMPVCEFCEHRRDNSDSGIPVCEAYPDGIPALIYNSSVLHTEPLEGDNGIQFVAIKGREGMMAIQIEALRKTGVTEGVLEDLTPFGDLADPEELL